MNGVITIAFVPVFLALIAQVGLEPSIVSLVGNGVTVAVLAFYVIHDIKVRTPAMLAAFASEQGLLRATFTNDQKLLRNTFVCEQDELRRVFTSEQGAAHQHYNSILDRMRETFATEQNTARLTFITQQQKVQDRYDQELSQMRQMLFDNMKSMRDAVHDVKDTAQTLMSKDELLAKHEMKKPAAGPITRQ